MHDGDKEYKIEVFPKKVFEGEPLNPSKFTAHAEISIPNVTGNIEINIDVVEYCFITINIPADGGSSLPLIVRKGGSSGLKLSLGLEIISAKAYRNGVLLSDDLYDEKYDIIRIGKEFTTEDFEIRVELAQDQTPEPTE